MDAKTAPTYPWSSIPFKDGFIEFKGHQVWYRVVGESHTEDKLPLLVLHGGPGAAHDYLEPISLLANTGRQVIFYDQLGCGLSDHLHNPDFWTVDLFVEEVAAVRNALGLERLHILGQSWGGMLAMEYALTQPLGVASLTIANSPASMIQWVSEANRLREELPPEVQATLLKHEADGTTDSLDYQDAVMVFYLRHVCRQAPFPDYVMRSFAQIEADPEVYHTMNGPSEFHCIGKLKDWDIIDRLGEIKQHTLVISGKFDEATPLIAETVHDGILGSLWVLFNESSHMPHVEEQERYMSVVSQWLAQNEGAANEHWHG
jgi:proline-specific peptidase